MQLYKKRVVDGVEMHEFGGAPIGKPAMTVYSYYLDGLLIDTAQRHCEEAVKNTLTKRQIEQIALTHWHEDHSGNAQLLQQLTNAPIYAHELTKQKLRTGFPILPYEYYFFGKIRPVTGVILPMPESIETSRHRLVPIFTPGHSEDHYVFIERNKGWLFAGDLFVGVKIKVFRKSENIHQQIASIRQLLKEDFEVIFCGHSPQLSNGKALFQAKLNYFEELVGKVLALHQQGFSEREIRQQLLIREAWGLRLFTFNDVGATYLIRSAIEHQPTPQLV
ncbi:MAG: MBL fold metallo-hydrolase [Spirosomataceae bacterium]